jgi:hypothetical protein
MDEYQKKYSTPSAEELENAYHQLLAIHSNLSLEFLVNFSKYCRFDPRIAEAFLIWIEKNWQQTSALQLRLLNLQTQHPATLGVLLEQTEHYRIQSPLKSLFRLWKNTALFKTQKNNGESFLIGVHPFASLKLLTDAQYALRSFLKWGFSGSEVFVNKALNQTLVKNHSGICQEMRIQKLQEFIHQQKQTQSKRFTVEDYLHYLNFGASRRVAQQDLHHCKKVRSFGNTRNRYYICR